MNGIRASSKALRNSHYVEPDIKKKMLAAILEGWARISKIILCLSHTLAHSGKAIYEGWSIALLDDNFDGSFSDKLKAIYIANPSNVGHPLFCSSHFPAK